MATQISSISSNPAVRVVARRDGGEGRGAEQFRDQMAKQNEPEEGSGKAQKPSKQTHHSVRINDGEIGTQLDITG